MKEHIDILLLLEYAQDKISDEAEHDRITDHLGECGYCQKILESHYYLLHHHERLIDFFFPGAETVAEKAGIEPAVTISNKFSPLVMLRYISEKISVLKNQGAQIGMEIQQEISGFLEEIKLQTHIEEMLVPVKVENLKLLGVQETKESKETGVRLISENIKIHYLPVEGFRMEDFNFEFTGKFLYVSYEKENFNELKGRSLSLLTGIASPFIFTTVFNEVHRTVVARFKLEFKEGWVTSVKPEKEKGFIEFLMILDKDFK